VQPDDQGEERQMFDEREKETLLVLLRFCLKQLVDDGYVEQADVVGRFHVDFGAVGELARSGQAAATVQDQEGHAVVLLDPIFGLRAAIWAIPHEAVHVAQICRGDLKNPRREIKLWKGKLYESLPPDDPRYSDQPWEAEAFSLDRALRKAMREHYAELNSLLSLEN